MAESEKKTAGRPDSPLIKFCGMTRPEDASAAARLGAAYVGAIFATSPRQIDEATALSVFGAAGSGIASVAVFSGGAIEDIAAVATRVSADVIQLHGDVGPATIEALRARFPGRIWAVASVDPDGALANPHLDELAREADAILFDTRVSGKTGGTGVTFNWTQLAATVERIRHETSVVLAGGLDAGNVAAAIRALQPDVVDVSSGVEAAPGIKDHSRMLAFAEAARSASIDGGKTTSSSQ
ncbi:MAG: phosphoribosylanthranilate isomerase [Gemmatimonadaceae bacterium]